MGDRGATTTVLVQSLRLQCGAREAHAALREYFVHPVRGALVSGTTQLMRAAMLNNLPRVLQLIQLGAPLDLAEGARSLSALHFACARGHELVAAALLDGKYEGRGAAVDARSNTGVTPLMLACYRGREAIVRLLLSRGANQELQDESGYTALNNAVTCDQPGIVALLCAAPGAAAAFNVLGEYLRPPLDAAIYLCHDKCADVLRAHGVREWDGAYGDAES